MKYRVRLGIKLFWPIQNAAIMVIRNVNEDQKNKLDQAVALVRTVLSAVSPDALSRFVYEPEVA